MELNQSPPSSQNPESNLSQQHSAGQPSAVTSKNGEAAHEETFRHLSAYTFDTDQEYQHGLAAILGHPDTPATPDEIHQNQDLVLQAKTFYFARKFNTTPVDLIAYKSWLNSGTSVVPPTTVHTTNGAPSSSTADASAPDSTSAATTDQPPPYPTSFAHIVDLITQNKPIPGIEEIPTTVLEPGSSKQDHTPRRRKPWETEEATAGEDTAGAENMSNPNILRTEEIAPAIREMRQKDASAHTGDEEVETRRITGQGVVRILQPNAIADTGLVAKD